MVKSNQDVTKTAKWSLVLRFYSPNTKILKYRKKLFAILLIIQSVAKVFKVLQKSFILMLLSCLYQILLLMY